MSNTEQMVSVPFQREDRYIVIKVSDLAIVPPAVGKPFAEQLIAIQRRLPKRECLVIESDWPEYEPTWAAIEARVAGKPAQHQGEPVAYQFQARDGTWRGFQSQNHYINTVEDGTWPIRPLYTHPAPVQQGKPVAFYREFVDGREYCEKPFTNDWTPLYTHADAGEVERLRASEKSLAKDLAESLKQQCADMRTIGALRAQMTARDVLLREADEFMYIMTGHDSHARLAHRYGEKWWDAIDNLRGRVNSAISASAEPRSCGACAGCTNGCQLEKDSPPSAQAERDERDERADFEADQLSKGFAIDLLPGTVATYMIPAVRFAWAGWQARAALERKP